MSVVFHNIERRVVVAMNVPSLDRSVRPAPGKYHSSPLCLSRTGHDLCNPHLPLKKTSFWPRSFFMAIEQGHAVADELSTDVPMRREPMFRNDPMLRQSSVVDNQVRRPPSSSGLYDV